MSSNILYSPTLDRLLFGRKICKVPYSQRSGRWYPRVGDQCWSYRKDNMFTVVSVSPKVDKIMLRWGLENDKNYEIVTMETMPDAHMVFRDWEFDVSSLKLGEELFDSFMGIVKGSANEVSIKGAEIKALCALQLIPIAFWGDIVPTYIQNTAKYKINDNVYYWFHYDEKYGMSLVRDLEKSPKKYVTMASPINEKYELIAPSITELPYLEQKLALYNLNDTMLQYELDGRTSKIGTLRNVVKKFINWFQTFSDICIGSGHTFIGGKSN